MSVITIEIDNVDVTGSVIFADAKFTSSARGAGGTCFFRLRDLNHTASLVIGREIVLTVDGVRQWGGYVMRVHRGYFAEALNCDCAADLTPRYLMVEGVDYNILFQKRVVYNKIDPTEQLTRYPANTTDQDVIVGYINDHTDLGLDGVTTTLVEHVGTPSMDDEIFEGVGVFVGQFMQTMTVNTGAIWYIDPDKALVLTDVDTPNAAFGISDDPGVGEIGCRDMTINFTGTNMRNDAMVWGAGEGYDAVRFARVEDAASIAVHDRWQVGDFRYSIFRQATIDRVADSYVYGSPQNKRGGKDDATAVRCTIFEPIRVAQKAQVRADAWGYTDVLPVRELTITFPTPTDAQYSILLTHEIDDPWSTFEWVPFPEIPPFPPIPPIQLNIGSFNGCPHRCSWQISGFNSSGWEWIPHWSPYTTGSFPPGWVGYEYGQTIDPPPFVNLTMSNWLHYYLPNVSAIWKGGLAVRRWGDLVPDFDSLYVFTLDRFHLQSGAEEQSRVELVSGGTLNVFPESQTSNLSNAQGIFLRFSTTASNHGYGWYSGGTETVVQFPWATGRKYAIRIRLEGAATDFSTDRAAKMKIWEVAIGEPPEWTMERTFPSSPPSMTMVNVSGWTDTAPFSVYDHNEVTFDYIGPYGDRCAPALIDVSQGNGEEPFCGDTFDRVTLPGGWGEGPCGEWVIDPTSYEDGAYVSSGVGHLESGAAPATSGPRLRLMVSPGSVDAWMATFRLSCIALGARNNLEFFLNTTGGGVDYLTPDKHRVQFTLDPLSASDTMNVIHDNTGTGGGLGAVPFTFVAGRSYDVSIVISDGTTACTVNDLTSGEVFFGTAQGTAPIGTPTFTAVLYQAFSPGQGEQPSHFTVGDLKLYALTESDIVRPCPDQSIDGPFTGSFFCETGTHIDGADATHTYIQLSGAFNPGQTEVWVDGLRARLDLDYIEHADDGILEILEHLDADSKIVHACYVGNP